MIMSVDQGFSNYAYTLWDGYKHVKSDLIQTRKETGGRVSTDMIRRHEIISSGLSQVMKDNRITLLIGEMPGFGAQSSSAAVAMTMASAITLTLCLEHNIPTIWHTPREIKRCFTGNPNASKKDMMNETCKRHGWPITFKKVKDQSTIGYREDATYHVDGEALPANKFEHIADSIGAYYTARYYYDEEREDERTNKNRTNFSFESPTFYS